MRIANIPVLGGRAVDPHSIFPDPDPAVFLNANTDPDPASFLNLIFNHQLFLHFFCQYFSTFPSWIRIQEGNINADPCGSGSTALTMTGGGGDVYSLT